MKELSPEALDWLNSSPIEPCFLIELELDEVLHISTRQRYEHDGMVFEPGHVQGLRVTQSEVSFGLINEGHRYTTPALMGAYQRAPVKVWWTEGYYWPLLIEAGYVEDGYYHDSGPPVPTLIFQGNLSHFSQITSVLGVVATRSAARRYPTLRVLPPLANYVLPEGSIISLGGTTYRLEPRER